MALYHKHRPQRFEDIFDQQHIVTTLTNQILNNRVAHAYLFTGPRGVGKTTTARILAKALNCEKRKESSSEPCNTCPSCEEISSSRSIDVIEIDAASHTGVDNVRENIIENVQFKPTKSKYKIFIIDEVHMLSTASFNALLKTLEEPPSYVVFILATTDPQKLPDTILSRCQRFTFSKVLAKEMNKYLLQVAKEEGLKVDGDVLERIIKKSEGCVRDAISLLDQLMATGEKHITSNDALNILPTTSLESQITFTEHLLKKEARDAIAMINTLTNEGVQPFHFAQGLVDFLRSLMIALIDPALATEELDLNDDAKKKMGELTKLITYGKIVLLIDMALKRSTEIKSCPIPQLPLEMLVVEWCGGKEEAQQHNSTTAQEQKKEKYEQQITTSEQKTKTANTITSYELPVTNHETKKNEPSESTTSLNSNDIAKNPTEPKKTIIECVKELVTPHADISLADVQSKWKEVISVIEVKTPSLSFILKMAELRETQHDTLILAVPYSFHRDKLMEKPVRHNLETILSELLNAKARVDVIIEEKNVLQPANEDLQALASALGGEVIN